MTRTMYVIAETDSGAFAKANFPGVSLETRQKAKARLAFLRSRAKDLYENDKIFKVTCEIEEIGR